MPAASGRRGRCVHPGAGEPLGVVGGEVLLGGRATDGRFTVIRSHAPAGDEVPPHVHHDVDECFVVLSGAYTVSCGDDTFTAGPGALVYLPRGVPHSYRTGDEPTSKLIIGVPAKLEAFFRDMDHEDVDALQHDHDVTFLSPPATVLKPADDPPQPISRRHGPPGGRGVVGPAGSRHELGSPNREAQ